MNESLSSTQNHRLPPKQTSLSDIAQLIGIIEMRNRYIFELRGYESYDQKYLDEMISFCDQKIKKILNL